MSVSAITNAIALASAIALAIAMAIVARASAIARANANAIDIAIVDSNPNALLVLCPMTSFMLPRVRLLSVIAGAIAINIAVLSLR